MFIFRRIAVSFESDKHVRQEAYCSPAGDVSSETKSSSFTAALGFLIRKRFF